MKAIFIFKDGSTRLVDLWKAPPHIYASVLGCGLPKDAKPILKLKRCGDSEPLIYEEK